VLVIVLIVLFLSRQKLRSTVQLGKLLFKNIFYCYYYFSKVIYYFCYTELNENKAHQVTVNHYSDLLL